MPFGCSDRKGSRDKINENDPGKICKDKEECPLTEEFEVIVQVRTRLGNIPIEGIKATVDGQDFGESDEKGEYPGKTKIINRKCFNIETIYENKDEHLKKETCTIKITNVDPIKESLSAGHKTTIEGYKTIPAEDKEDFTDELPNTSFVSKDLFKWENSKESGKKKNLTVIIEIATFSLRGDLVYINQCPGSAQIKLIKGKDPESNHKDFKEKEVLPEYKGGRLCFPTCSKMLLSYWGVTKSCQEIVQEIYKIWSTRDFDKKEDTKRIDKNPSRCILLDKQPTLKYPQEYWLDTSQITECGFRLYKFEWVGNWEKTTEFIWVKIPPPSTLDPKALKKIKYGKKEPDIKSAKKEGLFYRQGSKKPDKTDVYWESKKQTVKYTQKDVPKKPQEGEIWKNDKDEYKVWKHKLKDPKLSLKEPVKSRRHKLKGTWRASFCNENGIKIWENAWNEKEALTKFTEDAGMTVEWKYFSGKPNALDKPNQMKEIIERGLPFICSTNATGSGHMILCRGCVVKYNGIIDCFIFNDPYGNLSAGIDSNYRNAFKLEGNVGNKLTTPEGGKESDIKVVQTFLSNEINPKTKKPYYSGDINGKCSGKDGDPLVEAIRAFQKTKGTGNDGQITKDRGTHTVIKKTVYDSYVGKEKNDPKKTTGEESMRGKHVYYNQYTYGSLEELIVNAEQINYRGVWKKTQGATFIRRKTEFTKEEIAKKLTKGA